MRAIAAASAESGKPPMPPDSIAARSRSRRNWGFPPDRWAMISRTWRGNGASVVASWVSRNASLACSESSFTRTTVGNSGAVNRDPASRRAMANNQGRSLSCPHRKANNSAEAPSMLWAFSISINVGPGIMTPRNRSMTSCSLGRRFFSASISTSGVGAMSSPKGIAISGSHGTRSGASVATVSRRRSVIVATASSRPKCMNSRSSSLHTAYGVDAV